MISEPTRSRNPAGHAGLLANLLALASALAEFFESRFVLLAQESKAALVQLLVLAACLILALFLCVLGYVFLISSAIVGVAHLARDFVAMDCASRCWSAFSYCIGVASGRTQPNNQAGLSRDGS